MKQQMFEKELRLGVRLEMVESASVHHGDDTLKTFDVIIERIESAKVETHQQATGPA